MSEVRTRLPFCLSVLAMGKTITNETQDSMQSRLLAEAAQNQSEIEQQLIAAYE